MSYINLRPRLLAAAELTGICGAVADVGCDHGRLSVALLQQGRAERVYASDISEASQQKAGALAALCGVEDSVVLSHADGLDRLIPGSADAIVIAGMGGQLIARILENGEAAARTARTIVMQPMRGTAELREYLYTHAYEITAERVVLDAGRYYQLIAAHSGTPRPFPPDFPEGMYKFGAEAFRARDPLLLPMLKAYLAGNARRMAKAHARGVSPEGLQLQLSQTEAIINALEGPTNEA